MRKLDKAFENQWYVIALSEELKRGTKRAVKLFGQDIVVWRRSDDSLCAIDARCPHMGASLAIGRVVDDAVECPYHGFSYDSRGRCIKTPLREPDALIPRTLCNRHYAIGERGGWMFLFWGEAEDAPTEIPHFAEIQEPLLHSWSVREWPVSFTRFIENTVDIAHLGTVHRGTLDWSIPDIVDVEYEVNGNFIDLRTPSAVDLPVVTKIMYPNMALLLLHPKFLTVFAAVPLDDERTRVYVRSAQGMVRWPIIGRIVSKIKHWADMAALWQDKKALFSVRPIKTEDAQSEVLMEFDSHIAAYRKMRQQHLQSLQSQQTDSLNR